MAQILIVDDSQTTIEVVKVHLMGNRHCFQSASSAEAAIELASRHAPDLVISDLAMPGASGLELCARFRSVFSLKGCPFVLVTANADDATRRKAFAAGVDAFLTKPIDSQRLSAVVSTLLNR